MNPRLDPYRILQVRPDASQEEIKVAFRRLARRYHPDRADDAISNGRMIEVNQAWELLGDPVRRAAYDRAHGIVVRPRAAGTGAGDAATTGEPDGSGGDADAAADGWTAATAGTARPAAPLAGTARPTEAAERADPAAAPSPTSGDAGHDNVSSAPLPPPHRPGGRTVGTTLAFGRYQGWTLGEIARVEPEYLEWLVRMPIGWQYRGEIGELLAARTASAPGPASRPAPARRRGFLGR